MKKLVTKLGLKAMRALAEKAEQIEKDIFKTVRNAVQVLHKGAAYRAACEEVARYFGEGTVKGMTRPVYVARFKSRRDAVAAVFGTKTKKETAAAEQKMLRYLEAGYDFLGVKAPKKGPSGPKKKKMLDRALASAKKFLGQMTQAERLAYVASVTKMVKHGMAEQKKKAA